MNKFDKINEIQTDYIFNIIKSIDNIDYSYLCNMDIWSDSADQVVKNMIMKRQQDIFQLSVYLAKKQIKTNIKYYEDVFGNVNSKSH